MKKEKKKNSFLESLLGVMILIALAFWFFSDGDVNDQIAELEAEVKAVPVSNYNKNLELYKKLLELDPENDRYKQKIEIYTENKRVAETLTPEERDSLEAERKETEAKETLKIIAEYSEKIQREIDGFSDGFDPSVYKDNRDSILIGLALFSVWATMIEEGESLDLNFAQKEQRAILRQKIIEAQVETFPKFREAYGPILDKNLWEFDIDARSFGKNHKTIEFVGGIFAANSNIKEFHILWRETFQNLRFKQIRYKWFDDASEYTYFDINPPADNELIIWENNDKYREVS